MFMCCRVIGVLEAWNKRRDGGFGQEDKSYMEGLSHLCALMLLQCQLQQRAERASLHWKVGRDPAVFVRNACMYR